MRAFRLPAVVLVLGLAALLAACAGQQTAAPTPAAPTPAGPTPAATGAPATRAPAPARPTEPPSTATATLAPGMYRNPVLDHDFPDPDVLKVGVTYYAYSTNSAGVNIQVARSTDLVYWELLRDALPRLPKWAVQEFGWAWAPDVTTVDGATFIMYYTARFEIGLGGTQCIGLATSDNPDGPFESPAAEPFICQIDAGGSIDAASFVDDDGSRYLLWKNDGNSGGGQTWIYLQALSPDGLTLQGEPTRLITADQIWEGLLVEGPTLWKHAGRYHLFYSANAFNMPRYAVGHAVSDSLFGPYEKPSDEPFLAVNMQAAIIGPGGQDVVVAPDGETWMLFHGWEVEGYRSLNLLALRWENGMPALVGLNRDPKPAPQGPP